ncbi:putative protein CHROMATIN REMODELING 19 [Cocos nucifera]|nr:putative protein CHROMATIN REMODELING 19 [Cocos nucifera]
MRRVFDEISDDEWENHSFEPSRILKKSRASPPPIESFAYRPKTPGVASQNGAGVRKSRVDLEEQDDDEDVVTAVRPPKGSRGRRFIVDEDSDADDVAEAFEIRSAEEDEEEYRIEDEEEEEKVVEEEEEEIDLVGKALQKCAEISTALRQELYGSSVHACDRYAEVEASSCRVVTQEDIEAACASEESDFEPILKPYQLVGVNFLLLLYRKSIGGVCV